MIGFDWFLVPRFAHRRACRRRHGRVEDVVGGSWALSLRGSSTGVVGQNCWLGAWWGERTSRKMVIWCHPIMGGHW